MAIDRGGLRYTIEVKDKFSSELRRFKREIASVKSELAGLRTARQQVTAARQQGARQGASADRAQLQRLRQLQANLRQQQALEKLRADILRTQRREQSAAAKQEIDLFRRRKEEEARAARQASANQKRQQRALAKTTNEVKKQSAAMRRLRQDTGAADGSVNRISFTFRRLFGIFAAFQAARVGGQLFTGLIADSLQYSRTLEDSQISLASLFSTVGKVSTVQGELLEGAQAFAAAQSVAADQTRKLQAEAVQTTATFQELLTAYQAGVGPGLEAGLNLDEIREVTVRVSQAAAALSVPQNQLIEEIRSLLRGTIQARTTIVASVLGITNEDIRQAKEAGNLFEFLQERLQGFRFAALATQTSFSGLLARLRDSFQIVGGAASLGLFNELKLSFEALSGAFLDLERDAEGKVVNILPNPDAVAATSALFDSLAKSVTTLREGFSLLSASDIGNLLGGLGAVFETASSFISGFVQGFVSSISTVLSLFGAIANQLGGSDGILPVVEAVGEFLGLWLGPILSVATALAGIKLLLFAIGPLVSVVSFGFNSLLSVSAALLKTIGLLPSSFFPILGVILLIEEGFRALFSSVLGFGLSFTDTITVVKLAVEQFLAETSVRFSLVFKQIANFVGEILQSPISAFATGLQTVLNAALGTAAALEAIGVISEGTRQSLEDGSAALESLISRAQDPDAKFSIYSEEDVDADRDRLNEIGAEFQAQYDQLAAAIAQRNVNQEFNPELEPGVFDQVAQSLSNIGNEVGGLLGIDFEQLSQDFADGLVSPEEIGTKLDDAVQQFLVSGRPVQADPQDSPLGKYLNGIIDNFQNGLSLIRPLVQQFSAFVADSIVKAFDPTDDTDLEERFARFLQNIAKLIIQTLVQVAIARAVLGLVGGPIAPGVGAATGAGFVDGGEIPDGTGHVAPLRPKGLDPRDTVNIWAEPGEFMVKRRVAENPKVGQFLRALNDGLIDPSALSALMGSSSRRHLSGLAARSMRGYAEGGSITSRGGATAGTSTSRSSGAPQTVMAIIPGNDQTMDKLINGGSNAFLRYVEDNAQEIEGRLRTARTGE